MVKLRQSRLQAKKWSTLTLVLLMLFMLKIVLLTLLAVAIFTIPIGDDDSLPNDLTSSHRLTTERRIVAEERGEQWTEIVAWEPRAFIYHNFLSKAECEYLIELAKPHLVMAKVFDFKTGRNVASRVRTSSATFLKRGQDKIIRDIEKRIAEFTLVPPEHGEGIQVLHYEVGQRYDAHHDFSLDEFNLKDGGQRMATLLMYLSDVEEGGETLFPYAKANFTSAPWWNDLSECARQGLSVKPKMGDALLFWSIRPDATLDPSSLHGWGQMVGYKMVACSRVQTLSYDIKRHRTSSGMFLRRGEDNIIRDIEKRIVDLTLVPIEHGEGIQVLHYQARQEFDPHCDYFHDEFNTRNGDQRMATLLMYLSDVEQGGETEFPAAKEISTSVR